MLLSIFVWQHLHFKWKNGYVDALYDKIGWLVIKLSKGLTNFDPNGWPNKNESKMRFASEELMEFYTEFEGFLKFFEFESTC
jgi:hypothetical protein